MFISSLAYRDRFHSFSDDQERKGMFKFWNIALVILTYCLTLYGTFLVGAGYCPQFMPFPNLILATGLAFLLGMLIWAFICSKERSLLKGSRKLQIFLQETAFF